MGERGWEGLFRGLGYLLVVHAGVGPFVDQSKEDQTHRRAACDEGNQHFLCRPRLDIVMEPHKQGHGQDPEESIRCSKAVSHELNSFQGHCRESTR